MTTHEEIKIMKPADLNVDPDARRLAAIAAQVRREADALEDVLMAAIDAQWTPAPVTRPRDAPSDRVIGPPSDPTSDIALDPDRFALREQVTRSMQVLRCTVVALRGVRRGLERALASWTGDGE